MITEHQIRIGPPKDSSRNSWLSAFCLDVHLCMNTSLVKASTACLGPTVNFCLASLLPCPPLFYSLTDSNHSFNSPFKRLFRTKNYEKQFCVMVTRTDSRATLSGFRFLSLARTISVSLNKLLKLSVLSFICYKTEMVIIEPTS